MENTLRFKSAFVALVEPTCHFAFGLTHTLGKLPERGLKIRADCTLLRMGHGRFGLADYNFRLPERGRTSGVPIIPADQADTLDDPEIACLLEHTADCSEIMCPRIRRRFKFF